MKEILRKYVKGACSVEEFKKAVSALAGFSYQRELNDFMHIHWRNYHVEASTGEKNRFSQVLDSIHHQINIEGDKISFVRRVYTEFSRIAAILIIPLMVAAGVWMVYQRSDESVFMTSMSTPPGIQSRVELPDGSVVWLNSGSEIRFPVSFKGLDKRKVHLSGEGYFEVAHNKAKPFVVTTDYDIGVRVTGTSYDVSAYPNDPNISVALVKGSVQLLKLKNEEEKILSELSPGQVSRFEKKSGKMKVSKEENLDPFIAWREGRLVFVNEPLDAVLRQMERKYNVRYQIEDEELLAYRITGTFLNETLDEFLKLIATSSPIGYEIYRPAKTKNNVFEKRIVKLKRKK